MKTFTEYLDSVRAKEAGVELKRKEHGGLPDKVEEAIAEYKKKWAPLLEKEVVRHSGTEEGAMIKDFLDNSSGRIKHPEIARAIAQQEKTLRDRIDEQVGEKEQEVAMREYWSEIEGRARELLKEVGGIKYQREIYPGQSERANYLKKADEWEALSFLVNGMRVVCEFKEDLGEGGFSVLRRLKLNDFLINVGLFDDRESGIGRKKALVYDLMSMLIQLIIQRGDLKLAKEKWNLDLGNREREFDEQADTLLGL